MAFHNEGRGDEWKYLPKKMLLLPLLLWVIDAFIPSTKTLSMIYVLPEIMQNKNFKALPNDIAAWLRKQIEETEKEKLK